MLDLNKFCGSKSVVSTSALGTSSASSKHEGTRESWKGVIAMIVVIGVNTFFIPEIHKLCRESTFAQAMARASHMRISFKWNLA